MLSASEDTSRLWQLTGASDVHEVETGFRCGLPKKSAYAVSFEDLELTRQSCKCFVGLDEGEQEGRMYETERRKRILVVDDERIITDTLVAIFSREGYEARGSYSAEAVLALIPEWTPDLLIIDVRLPHMNGIDLAILLKAEYPQCRISLFSGQAATSNLLETAALAGHSFDVLAKPVPPSEMLKMARRMLVSSAEPIQLELEN
jgi:CheY-like chemotaxis protein